MLAQLNRAKVFVACRHDQLVSTTFGHILWHLGDANTATRRHNHRIYHHGMALKSPASCRSNRENGEFAGGSITVRACITMADESVIANSAPLS